MHLSSKLFGKSIDELSIHDIELFFKDAKEESDVLEFKAYGEKNQSNHKLKEDAVLKTICAFLNSSGGIFIWGAPIGKAPEGNKEKVFQGELSPVEIYLGKDAFISKVSTRIIPVPSDVRVAVLEVVDNKYVYIIEVKESQTKPHQLDDRYYMRLDGQTKTAPHHYIEALFKQIRYPDLGGYIKLERIGHDGSYYQLAIKVVILNHSPFQNEESVSFCLTCAPGKIRSAENHTDDRISPRLNNQQIFFKNFVDVLHYGEMPTHQDVLYISINEIVKDHNRVKIFLALGGKYSPMKVSEYNLKIDTVFPNDIYDLLESYEENKLIYEIGKDKGSESEKIEGYLGRKK